MEMPGRRSNYSLLSQTDDDLTALSSGDGKNNRSKLERVSDWDSVRQGNRIGIGLQRQSSGSSFGESSLSGEFYAPTLSSTAMGNEVDGFKFSDVRGSDVRGRFPAAWSVGSSGKSWAQQTEERRVISYSCH